MQSQSDVVAQILQLLWQQHLASEEKYIWIILLAPVLGLVFFLVLWRSYRAHLSSLGDAIAFFFAPRGPSRMLLFKDLAGNRVTLYDYSVVKTDDGSIVQAGPYLIKTKLDPDEYAEPVSLVDAKGAPGVPSPFGLLVRQLVGLYIILSFVIIAFSNTIWTTMTVYSPVLGVSLTGIDLMAFAALVIGIAWFIGVLMRVFAPQTMLASLVAIGSSGDYIEAIVSLDPWSSAPPSRILQAIDRQPQIVVSETAREALERVEQEFGSRALGAAVLALLSNIYNTWRKTVAILLQDKYDISVAAGARYLLEREKLPTGRIQRYSGWIALAAIIIGLIALGMYLGVQVEPVENTTVSHGQVSTVTVTPSEPPSPSTGSSVTITPAQPPPPENTTSVNTG